MKNIFRFIYAALFLLSTAILHVPLTAQSQELVLSAEIQYPRQVKVGETAYVEVHMTSILPDNAIPSVKINTSTSPQEDFMLIEGYPASAIRFKKAGDYAFTVNSGFMLQDA